MSGVHFNVTIYRHQFFHFISVFQNNGYSQYPEKYPIREVLFLGYFRLEYPKKSTSLIGYFFRILRISVILKYGYKMKKLMSVYRDIKVDPWYSGLWISILVHVSRHSCNKKMHTSAQELILRCNRTEIFWFFGKYPFSWKNG